MPQTSSPGVGAPKQRTINVEVNLLSEWIESRSRLREERLRWTGILVSLALFSLILLPYLSSIAGRQQTRAHRAIRNVEALTSQIDHLNAQLAAIQPQINGEATLQLCRGRSQLFMSQLYAVLNATTPRSALESAEATVLGGDMTLRVKAQAQDYAAAQEFVDLAGKGNRVKSSILASSRQNAALGPSGVAFEFAKKVRVGP